MKSLVRLKMLVPTPVKDLVKKCLPDSLISDFKAGEVHIISFPKCGRSWLKLLLCDMVYAEFPEFDRINDVSTEYLFKVHERIPRILFSHDDNPHYKTVDELEINKLQFSKTQVIFLARDPRDILVSWFYEYKNRVDEDFKAKVGFMKSHHPSDFIYNERGGLKTLVGFYNIWASELVKRHVMLVKYEDLKLHTVRVVEEMLRHMDIFDLISPDSRAKAIEQNEFDKVQKRELTGDFNLGTVSHEFGSPGPKRTEFLKARKGKIGGYREVFTDQDIDFIDNYLKQNLNPIFGY